MKKTYYVLPHLLFISIAVSTFSPSLIDIPNPWPFFTVIAAIEAALLWKRKSKTSYDIALIMFLLLFFWEFMATKTGRTNTLLVPVPEKVFAVIFTDRIKILKGVWSSLGLLFTALGIGIFLAVSLGMVAGWYERLRSAALPIARVISPIPPLVYTPYVVALFPTFRSASLFIIFNSFFWGTFINIILSVANVDRRILESAKTLNTGSAAMFIHILFPYCLPRLITGLSITLPVSFMVLTGAELIGATTGLGWYVKYYSDFADYTRVLAGIIVIGVVVTFLNKLVAALEKLLIKWR
jgi:NitT/TauT family transport system permease protein